MRNNGKITNIVELSTVIQGEGRYQGTLSLLIRFSGCPLRCSFGANVCDSSHTSWTPQRGRYSVDEAITFMKNSSVRSVIITGGEPLASPSNLRDLCNAAHHLGKHVTIETSGACKLPSGVIPSNDLFLSISPKLANSVPARALVSGFLLERHNKLRVNLPSIADMIQQGVRCKVNHSNYQMKFVVSNASDIDEILDIVGSLSVPAHNVYLMPEGVMANEINAKRVKVMELCMKYGFNYSDRLHVLAYNNKKYV